MGHLVQNKFSFSLEEPNGEKSKGIGLNFKAQNLSVAERKCQLFKLCFQFIYQSVIN